MTCLLLGVLSGTQAQHVPGAIKYQAVLRDVNGKTLANKENVNLRISLRLDDPMTGTIAYSEEHMGLATNAYGVINLEIGRGTVTSGKDLYAVPWAERDIYVQIEIETDGTGYTHMGNAELLTVPYAFYAENANNDKLYENLDDNVLPKYNAANKTLVNSGVSQQGRNLEVDASSVIFINKADGDMNGYKFPMTVGRRGQVLGFTDNVGTLDWFNVEGGGSGGEVHLDLQGDGQLVYWNDDKGELDTVSALRYDYKGARKLELNTDIIGNNNVLVSDKLGDGQIWVGDGFSNRLAPVNMSGAVLMDKTGNTKLNLDGHVVMTADNKTRLNLAMKGGIKLIPGKNGARDTLEVAAVGGGGRDTVVINNGGGGGGESLWETSQSANGYTRLFPKSTTIENVYVGIGNNNPTALFHVMGSAYDARALFSECDVEFATATVMAGYNPTFQWFKEKGALFAGALSEDNFTPSLGMFSFALGADASAVPNYTFALGQGAGVAKGATNAFAIGNGSNVAQNAVNSMAVGYDAKVAGTNSVALGYRTDVSGNNSVALGSDLGVGENAVVIGYGNKGVGNNPIQKAVVIGKGNTGNTSSDSDDTEIVLGTGNMIKQNSIIIGNGNTSVPSSALVVGNAEGKQYDKSGPIVIGTADISHATASGLVAVGNGNDYLYNNQDKMSYSNMFGSQMANEGEYQSLTMIGDSYISTFTNINNGEEPVFMYGSRVIENERGDDKSIAFEISNMGNAYFIGDVYSSGTALESDERLKTDIQPMLWTPSFLDSITPVSYIFKSDKQQRTRFGFIAQDVRRVFPELVRGDEDKGMLSLDYVGLVPVLWQINQNLSHQVNDLEKRLEEQCRKQAELESQLQAIKEKLGM